MLKEHIQKLVVDGVLLELSKEQLEDVLTKNIMRVFLENKIYNKTRNGSKKINRILSAATKKLDCMVRNDENHLTFTFAHRLFRSILLVVSFYCKMVKN